jgi:hypothetical protein
MQQIPEERQTARNQEWARDGGKDVCSGDRSKKNLHYHLQRLMRAGERDRSSSPGSLFHIVQTGSGAHLPIQWVQWALSTAVKRPECEPDHLTPTSTEVKKTRIYASTPPYAFLYTRIYLRPDIPSMLVGMRIFVDIFLKSSPFKSLSFSFQYATWSRGKCFLKSEQHEIRCMSFTVLHVVFTYCRVGPCWHS